MKKDKFLVSLILAFYLGTYNGNLALWQDGCEKPYHIYPYSASIYTKIDQIKLSQGINISDIGMLDKYLEDYLS